MPERPLTGSPATTAVRRVITGASDAQESTFVIDDEVPAIINGTTGLGYWRIWGNDELNQIPLTAEHEWLRTVFPAVPEGHRVHVIEFPADGADPLPAQGEWPPYGLAPDGRHDDPERPGMHWTDTIDVVVVIEGRIGVEQGDGSVKVLERGEILVQNGALHAWRLQDVPCRVVVVALGASRAEAADR